MLRVAMFEPLSLLFVSSLWVYYLCRWPNIWIVLAYCTIYLYHYILISLIKCIGNYRISLKFNLKKLELIHQKSK